MPPKPYIVMPFGGWRSERMADFARNLPLTDIASRALADVVAATGPSTELLSRLQPQEYKLLQQVQENGPTLIAMAPETAVLISRAIPSVVVEPNRRVVAAQVAPARFVSPRKWWNLAEPRIVVVRVRDAAGQAVAGARVVACPDLDGGQGVVRRTNRNGTATFKIPFGLAQLPRLFVQPEGGWHGLRTDKVVIADNNEIHVVISQVDPAHQDALQRWRADLKPDDGKGVRVAVVDSGVNASHPDLMHTTILTSTSPALQDEGDQQFHPHATQVAGIIGARGDQFKGLAPAADLVSMRVTKRGMKDSDLYSLGNGIETVAREQDIHLINVSMTSKRPSLHLGAAAATALRQGAVCVAAAGNEGQGCIAHPAATKRFLAVTAYADKSVLAPGAIEWADVSDHVSGSEPDLSRARFSNWGSEADFMAPGVGIVSCFGDSGYAAGSGTSFAAPVITGLAAAVLSRHHSDILKMPKGPDRAARITEALLHRGRDLGFDFQVQGLGMLNVSN